jgi:para-aminobenzoate synthetase/4-amino-4-deoxychorismate lyase
MSAIESSQRPEGSALGVRSPGAARFRLIETMRWEAGAVQHEKRHAARLARSARHFGFAFSEETFHTGVQRATASLPDDPHRLRLTLGCGGDLQFEAAPLGQVEGGEPLRLVLAGPRAQSADPFFRHKTTWRRVYERAFEEAQRSGFDEALLLNERGEVTEAARANIFVEKDEALYTPPVRSGLLPGVGRAVLLAGGRAEERVLHLADLRAADALWLVSALRGRRRAVWGK